MKNTPKDKYQPSSLDAAYERRAMDQGLVTKPVFIENKFDVEEEKNKSRARWEHSIEINKKYNLYDGTEWGEPPPKANKNVPVYQLVMSDIMSRTSFSLVSSSEIISSR